MHTVSSFLASVCNAVCVKKIISVLIIGPRMDSWTPPTEAD